VAWLVAPVILLGCPNNEGLIGDDDDSGLGDDDVADDDAADDDAADDDVGDDDVADDDAADDDASANCSGGSGAETGGVFLDAQGASYWLYVPDSLPACAPLILHGHGGSSPGGTDPNHMWTDQLGTNLIAEADDHGFVLIVPFLEDVQHVNHTWSTDDCSALDGMIDTAAALADIDQDKVLFAGQSAGGHMSVYYSLYHVPDQLTHAAVVAAGVGSVPYPAQEPQRKLPFFVAHDPEDTIVPYVYSEMLVGELDAHGHDYVFEDYDLSPPDNHHGWSQALTDDLLDWWLGE